MRQWDEEILTQWDGCWSKGNFPLFMDTWHSSMGASKLTAFRTKDEWLTVIQIFAYYTGLVDFATLVYAYGNKVKKPGTQTPMNNIHLVQGDDGQIDIFDFKIYLNYKEIHYKFSKQDYLENGINVSHSISGDDEYDKVIFINRMLSAIIPYEELFVPDYFVLGVIGRPTSLPVFLQINNWLNPDNKLIKRPSESTCLQSLAHALADGSKNLYQCLSEVHNTDWRLRDRIFQVGSLNEP